MKLTLKRLPPPTPTPNSTYPEDVWLFLKHRKEAKIQKMSFLTAVPGDCLKVRKGPKKTSKFDQIVWLFKLIKKILNQSQKKFSLKKAYFLVTLIQAVKVFFSVLSHLQSVPQKNSSQTFFGGFSIAATYQLLILMVVVKHTFCSKITPWPFHRYGICTILLYP